MKGSELSQSSIYAGFPRLPVENYHHMTDAFAERWPIYTLSTHALQSSIQWFQGQWVIGLLVKLRIQHAPSCLRRPRRPYPISIYTHSNKKRTLHHAFAYEPQYLDQCERNWIPKLPLRRDIIRFSWAITVASDELFFVSDHKHLTLRMDSFCMWALFCSNNQHITVCLFSVSANANKGKALLAIHTFLHHSRTCGAVIPHLKEYWGLNMGNIRDSRDYIYWKNFSLAKN